LKQRKEDFDYYKQYIGVRFYPRDYFSGNDLGKNYLTLPILEDIYLALILDLPDHIRNLYPKLVANWEISEKNYFTYNISTIELIGQAKDYFQLENLSLADVKLNTSEFTSFPLNLTKTINDSKISLDKIEINLTGSAPVYNLFFEQGHPYSFSFEIFFELPLKEPTSNTSDDNKSKIITDAILGSLAVVGSVAGGTALIRRKRKLKPDTD